MKKPFIAFLLWILSTLFILHITGCNNTGTSAAVKEKDTVAAAQSKPLNTVAAPIDTECDCD